MKRVFSSFALRRSGHHAVTYWVFAHFKGSKFLNDRRLRTDITDHVNTYDNVFLTLEDQRIEFPAVESSTEFEETTILTLRDPFNLSASRLMHSWICKYSSHPKEMMSLWKEHARAYLDAANSCIPINYNTWVVSSDYRNKISQKNKRNKDA